MIPTNRQTLKDYCLRALGFPVIELNLDDDQIDDRVDQAIDMFQRYHFDGVNKVYMRRVITQDDIANKWIPVDDYVVSITRIFTLATNAVNSAATKGFNIFDINYQIRLNEMYDFSSADYVYFELANQHIRTLEMLFIGETPIRYNRFDHDKTTGKTRLWLDVDWGGKVQAGNYIVAEVYTVFGEDNNLFWNDAWLKQYTTTLIKEQWGTNLKKFVGVQLPGGITLNGQVIYDEAINEKQRLEVELRDTYEMPPMYEIG